MEKTKLLLGIAGVLGILLLAVYICPLLFGKPVVPPQELARRALVAETPVEREDAAVKLVQMGRVARPQMQELFEQSRAPEVRAAVITGLATQWDYESMPKLLDAIDDESPAVRARAVAAVQMMMSLEYNYKASDPPEVRQEIAKKLRDMWGKYKESPGYRRWKAYLEKR